MSRCTCASCGARFVGVAAFEAHRVGAFASSGRDGRRSSRRCLTQPAELVAAGLVLRQARPAAGAALRIGHTFWALADATERAAVARAADASVLPQFGPSVTPLPDPVSRAG